MFFPDVSYYFGKQYNGETISNSEELSLYLLKDGHVSMVHQGLRIWRSDNIRFLCGLKRKYATGIDRMKQALSKLND